MHKVIIVDDEMIVRHAVQTLIKWEGSPFEYAGSAASGASALELVERTQADIVITDIKMAEMDGLELIKRLMSEGYPGEILVLSNYDDFELVREALKCGAHDYMLKLTLKSEAFMRTLEEIADKLNAKNAKQRFPAAPKATDGATEEILSDLLLRADRGEELIGHRLTPEQRNAIALLQDSYCYSFALSLEEGQSVANRPLDLRDTIAKLAEGLFPSKQFLLILEKMPSRFTLILATPNGNNFASPEEVAQRLIKLSEMYYGLTLRVHRGQIAISFEELVMQLVKGKEAHAVRSEIQQALDYLEKHYSERVAVSDIASFVGLSEPYLCQIFKAETGSSLLTKLNDIRMNKAYEMLSSGRYLVKQAAIEVGIPDPFYFNRLFRKKYGIAPKNMKAVPRK